MHCFFCGRSAPSLALLLVFSLIIGARMNMVHATPAAGDRLPAWSASWIAYPDSEGREYEVLFFRRSFELDEVPASLPVHVSADNRYQLFVNGTLVSRGPARGDLDYWRYETVDLSPQLRSGENVLAAVVWNYADLRPVAQISLRTGFVVQGATPDAEFLNTDEDWLVMRSDAHLPVPVERAAMGNPYIVVGPGEYLNGATYPWGWNEHDYADERWLAAEVVATAERRGTGEYGAGENWQLVPRKIPPMEERLVRFDEIVRVDAAPDGQPPTDDFLRGAGDLVVAPGERVVLLLDQSHLTTAYPVLRTSGGRGATISLTYAEALFDEDGAKGDRDVVEGKRIAGIEDVFALDGGEDRTYGTLWWRTYRYVQMEIAAADEAVEIHDLHGLFTAYPFEERGSFTSDEEDLQQIWDVGWRTARLCAGETYFDCPYYEQLQYVGDTRIQALISLYVAGDDRLMRRAIDDFHHSRIPEGLTASRYPSADDQYIPPYSLFWIAMIYDHWMHVGDEDLVAQMQTGIRGVLDWFQEHVDDTGMLGPMPWWNFVDWSYPRRGIPPGADDGNSAVISLQYVYVLEMAAEMSRALGREEEARTYDARATGVKAAVERHCWDPGRGLFAETPAKEQFTEHTNVMAILVDLVEDEDGLLLMERLLEQEDVLPAGFYYRFYVHRALKRAGLGDRYLRMLEPWRAMLALGLTTFAENPGRTRSDCHAWSAAPVYDFLSLVCGVVPEAPGFSRVRIAPSLGALKRASGTIPHPLGVVRVELERDDVGGLRATISLPEDVAGTLEWNGREVPLEGGEQTVEI